jgi:hypothetical protein
MIALSDSIGDIDTSDQCVVFEGYQKGFVVNGGNLKVVDFINAELTHSALTTAHAKGDILTQAVTSATMVVDFTNTAKTKTYGYVTSGTFDTSNSVTGSGSGSAFTPSATDTGAPGDNDPHWYDWTVYPGGASGTMPTIAYLGCLYRGRCVLAGNPNYPFQWYMSRVADPWDWAYASNDATSPVAGGNADAGELGDIIRALVPYQDEYLIFGCSGSMWVLRGDPASGGSLEELDLTLGIFGADSWDFDGDGNFYFFSTEGLYRMSAGLGPIAPLSDGVLPHLAVDEALDPTVHRVIVAYDPARKGVVVTITTLATGDNSNYFYDLRTQGFYPETYPAACGVYSAVYYNSVDDAYRGLLLGGSDGYIRVFDDSEKNDVGTSSDSTITSTMILPIIQNEDDDREVRLQSLTVTLAGGAADGTFSDTDAVTINYFADDSAEEVVESILDLDTPHTTTALTGPGRQYRLRARVRGQAVGLEMANSTSDSTWAIERIAAMIEAVGKVREV